MFDNIISGSYPQNDDFDDLTIENKQRLFTERPIYCLTDNNVEMLKVSLIKRWLDNIRHKSNPQNADFDDLPFDGNERLIVRLRLYHIEDNVVFR